MKLVPAPPQIAEGTSEENASNNHSRNKLDSSSMQLNQSISQVSKWEPTVVSPSGWENTFIPKGQTRFSDRRTPSYYPSYTHDLPSVKFDNHTLDRHLKSGVGPLYRWIAFEAMGDSRDKAKQYGLGETSYFRPYRASLTKRLDREKPHCLINVDFIKLVVFGKDDCIPPYAILSHRWEEPEEEVGYQEFKQPTSETYRKMGYQKIVAACKQAQLSGLHYLWVDTCCINQDDKGDVHRNIKSMFAYYQHSGVCLAYLVDVDEQDFRDSMWFTRGWTLQELLAPLDVEFFNRTWESIGHRNARSREISIITGIPQDVIKGETRIYEVDVEERMSWSSRRETSRPPDRAYCLFGILGVSVEPNYDEDVQTAFSRLCEAWFKNVKDQSGRRRIMVPNMGRLYCSLRNRVHREAWTYRGRNDNAKKWKDDMPLIEQGDMSDDTRSKRMMTRSGLSGSSWM